MSEPSPQPTLADLMAVVQSIAAAQTDLAAQVQRLEDRMINRFEAVRADLLGIKADVAFEQRFGHDTAEALRRHQGDPNAHRDAA